jgi:hypothetical protein
MAPSSAPKKGKVHLPENEEVASKLFEKHRSMAEQPGGLPGQQAVDLSAAYRGVCAAKQPVRTLRDLLRTKYAMLPIVFFYHVLPIVSFLNVSKLAVTLVLVDFGGTIDSAAMLYLCSVVRRSSEVYCEMSMVWAG